MFIAANVIFLNVTIFQELRLHPFAIRRIQLMARLVMNILAWHNLHVQQFVCPHVVFIVLTNCSVKGKDKTRLILYLRCYPKAHFKISWNHEIVGRTLSNTLVIWALVPYGKRGAGSREWARESDREVRLLSILPLHFPSRYKDSRHKGANRLARLDSITMLSLNQRP